LTENKEQTPAPRRYRKKKEEQPEEQPEVQEEPEVMQSIEHEHPQPPQQSTMGEFALPRTSTYKQPHAFGDSSNPGRQTDSGSQPKPKRTDRPPTTRGSNPSNMTAEERQKKAEDMAGKWR